MHELVYTSARETLDGAGYGAVGKSDQFPIRLEKFIRQHLNQYDFAPGGPAEASSPRGAVFSYARFDDAGQTWHILSRVGFGGHDYTQRAVFLAHHVALASGEFANGNAAALMLDASLFVSRWDGQVGRLPVRPPPSRKPQEQRPETWKGCETWQALAGDPQWAQVWADRSVPGQGPSQFLIVPDPAATLNLYAEAAAFLGHEPPGGATFLTNLTSERSGVQWDWIGLAAQSEISNSVASRFPDRVFDLCRPLGRVPAAPRRRTAALTPAAPAKVLPAAAPVGARQPIESVADPWDQMIGEELMTSAAKRRFKSAAAASHSASLPPPPPPPPFAWKVRWLLITIVAGICLSTGAGWWLHAKLSGPMPRPGAQSPQTAGASSAPVAQRKKPTGGAAAPVIDTSIKE